MTDTTPRRRPIPAADAAASPEAETPEAPAKKAKYVVAGADIWTAEGRQAEGAVVELTAKEARHFLKAKKLEPYIPDDGSEEVI